MGTHPQTFTYKHMIIRLQTILQEFLAYWKDSYDWRAWEKKLNAFDQFKTTVEGIELHFVHERSARADAVPLLLLHGWPGSYFEFYKARVRRVLCVLLLPAAACSKPAALLTAVWRRGEVQVCKHNHKLTCTYTN